MTNRRLVIATKNQGKLREFKAVLGGLPFILQSLTDFATLGPFEETGKTYEENALLKARAVHGVLGGLVVADDSGIECEDLGGAPGIYSARLAGPQATDQQNNTELIKKLVEVHDPSRRCHYVCALALIDGEKNEVVFEETCEGMITFTPGGKGGFGYDPYFFIPEKKCTMAELSMDEKNRISHRGRALIKLADYLRSLRQSRHS